jgi:site-specific recombinase XerD
MTLIAPSLQAFFSDRLNSQLHASPHTVASYRDTFRLLVTYAHAQTGIEPSKLDFADLDAELVGGFLRHLETERANTARTRNNRLAAIRSFYRYASFREPGHADTIQRVLAIPEKRAPRRVVSYLTTDEADVLLGCPDTDTWFGRRDHALLVTVLQTGVRVAEIVGLTCQDVSFGVGAHIRVHGKGRKERATPLTRHTAGVLGQWLRERDGAPAEPVFATRRGTALSRDAVADLVAKYAATATTRCPTLAAKNITPHVLRHSCAMRLLHAGVDTSVIALWLGHEHTQSTQIYLHGDLTLKERALARTAPPHTKPGRYKPPDKLLAFLEAL